MIPRTILLTLLLTFCIGCKKQKNSDDFSPSPESLKIYKEIKKDRKTPPKPQEQQPSDYRRKLKPQ
ncbi:hypothetical protein KKF84_04870 [Myxococcota bacterium]|nr:hypothetical protein [Myxococcota bacterium]MBU1534628.1 hypothetical protein [Myxococcota bacterium]